MKQVLNFYPEFRRKQQYDLEILDLCQKDLLGEVPQKAGVYIIVANKTKFIYPKGSSKVIYIGKADYMKRRLLEHHNNLQEAIIDRNVKKSSAWRSDRYNYMKHHGAQVYVYFARGNQDAKTLESDFMVKFYEKYEAIPIGNGARSFRC